MQAKSRTEPYEFFDPVFDGGCEAPLDTEYNLPDYCPDIQKILKCRVIPEITSYVIAGDSLSCDGVCDVRVLYLDAKGDCVRCCDFTKDFSASVKLKNTEDKAVAYVKASLSHMTCRAVSARRIDLHGTISLSVLAVTQKREMITCGLEESTIEKKSETFPAEQAVNAVCHQFTIEDQLSLKNGKPPIENILRRDVSCRVVESRITDERLTVNGAADISFLYLSSVDGVTMEKMTASIDFSQIIDCAGANEDCICDLRVVTGECTIQPKEDDVGEYTGVNVTVKVFITAFLYRTTEVEIIDDAYSVRTPLSLHFAQSTFTKIHGINSEVLKKKCAISVPEDEIQKVVDIWCDQENVQSACDKGKLNYRVRYTLCLLYISTQGRIVYTEKPFDHNFTTEMEHAEAKKSSTLSHTDLWEYRIMDKTTVEVSVETSVTTVLYSQNAVKYLTQAETDESAAPYGGGSRLLVYYASPGEKLWDIAKSHRALLSDIRVQNDLYDETVTDQRPIIICNR